MKRAYRFLPAALWASLIFVLSSQSRLPDMPIAFDGVDKLWHCLFFGILCGLTVFGSGNRGRTALISAIIATSAYGAFDEIHQMFVPNRSPDVLDWLADTTGAIIAAAVIRLWRRRR